MNQHKRINMDLQYITNPTNKQYNCYLPKQRPTTLVAFDNLANAKEFESLIYDYMKNAEWDDELDSEYFDVTGGYVDDGDDYLSEYRCVGCYTVPVQDILNARNYDPNIIPGKEVVILNQKDLYDQSAMILCNIPDRFYR